MSQSCWKAVPRAKFRSLILSPLLFQDHTASEPTPATLLCSRFLSFPQSHSCGHSRTWGQTTLSQPGAFEPSPSCRVFLLPESIHPGSRGRLHSDLVSPGVLHCGGECKMLRAPAYMVLVCREPRHIMFLIGLGACGPWSLHGICVVRSNALAEAGTRLRVGSECVPSASLPTCP